MIAYPESIGFQVSESSSRKKGKGNGKMATKNSNYVKIPKPAKETYRCSHLWGKSLTVFLSLNETEQKRQQQTHADQTKPNQNPLCILYRWDMKKPRNGFCSNETTIIKCQSSSNDTNKSKSNWNTDNKKKKNRSFYEFSLSLIILLWFLVFLFYSKLGLSHDNAAGTYTNFLPCPFFNFGSCAFFYFGFLANPFPLKGKILLSAV